MKEKNGVFRLLLQLCLAAVVGMGIMAVGCSDGAGARTGG